MAWELLGWTLLALTVVALVRPAWLKERLRALGVIKDPPPAPPRPLEGRLEGGHEGGHGPDDAPAPGFGAPDFADTSGRVRLLLALAVAILADTVGVIPGEALPVVFDVAVAATLSLLLGVRPTIMIAMMVEAVPGLGLFPTWIAAVSAIGLKEMVLSLPGPK